MIRQQNTTHFTWAIATIAVGVLGYYIGKMPPASEPVPEVKSEAPADE